MTGAPQIPLSWAAFGDLREPPVQMAFALRLQVDWLRPWLTGELEHLSAALIQVDSVATALGGREPTPADPSALSAKQACELLDLIHQALIEHHAWASEVLPEVLEGHRVIASQAR